VKTEITFTLNGSNVTATVEGHYRLIDILRGQLRHTGTKEGCGKGECGACTVIVDGRAVNACLYPALEAEDKHVTTIEGLRGPDNELSPIQQAFVDSGAIQCGFCTPGMIMSAKALLDRNPDPDEDAIRDALLGNLCRCTGYVQIVEAVRKAAVMLRDAK
jgi:carbon-monoxide dehydrogenase small subunit